MIPTEYAKRADAWEAFKKIEIQYRGAFYKELVYKSVKEAEAKQG